MFRILKRSSESESKNSGKAKISESRIIGNPDGGKRHLMKAFFTEFLKFFLIINTAIMVIVWLNIFRYDTIWTMIIPQIFCASFVTSLVTTLFFSLNPKKPVSVPLRVLLYVALYLVLCIIIMGLGSLFNWFELSLKGALLVAVSVAGVYCITTVISYIMSKNEANEMTDALKNYKDEE